MGSVQTTTEAFEKGTHQPHAAPSWPSDLDPVLCSVLFRALVSCSHLCMLFHTVSQFDLSSEPNCRPACWCKPQRPERHHLVFLGSIMLCRALLHNTCHSAHFSTAQASGTLALQAPNPPGIV
ncbi:hypothetical protein LA080_003344 [Diaporthe eres]|nr:hypothetical protein LA080_003344 [Diaporthe eres]